MAPTGAAVRAYPQGAQLAGIARPDLGDPQVRARLTPPALSAFFAMMTRWGVRDEEARQLLGGVSRATFYEIKRKPARVCSVDELTRLSCLIGIYKALRILYDEPLADAWMTRPNTNRLFGGARPLDYVIAGGIPAMLEVRRLLDARRGA